MLHASRALASRAIRFLALAAAAALLVGATSSLAQVGFGQAKTIKSNGNVLVDLEPMAKFFGAKVTLNKRTKAIVVTKGKTKIEMRIGSDKAKLNGKESTLPAPPQIVEGKTMVPLRFLVEALGGKVEIQAGGIISICAPPPSSQCIAVKMPE